VETKTCSKCSRDLPKDYYHKSKLGKGGLRSDCKFCVSLKNKKWREKNTHRTKELWQDWYQENRELRSAYYKRYYKENAEHHRNRSISWKGDNKDRVLKHNADRRACLLKAKPSWLTGEQEAHIARTYKLRGLISEITGEQYHVDHIVPLKGDLICGLHVPWNLQVIPARENLTKGKSFAAKTKDTNSEDTN
jgi:hypothetical protein